MYDKDIGIYDDKCLCMFYYNIGCCNLEIVKR